VQTVTFTVGRWVSWGNGSTGVSSTVSDTNSWDMIFYFYFIVYPFFGGGFGGAGGRGGSNFGIGRSSCFGSTGGGGGCFWTAGGAATGGSGLGRSSLTALGGSV
jgi:hypothetical protein